MGPKIISQYPPLETIPSPSIVKRLSSLLRCKMKPQSILFLVFLIRFLRSQPKARTKLMHESNYYFEDNTRIKILNYQPSPQAFKTHLKNINITINLLTH